jgi:riboflavin synthase
MFTGLVEDLGTVLRFERGPMAEAWIQTHLGKLELGESISVNGACLTVVSSEADRFMAQLSPETLRRTWLSRLHPGDEVNLERAMTLSDRLGGHLVLGHVDQVTEIIERRQEGAAVVLELLLPKPLAPLFIEKGSVTLDGVSLTINSLSESRFQVALIPETQKRTTLGKKQPGQPVNVECDIIGKYVARLFSAGRGTQGMV